METSESNDSCLALFGGIELEQWPPPEPLQLMAGTHGDLTAIVAAFPDGTMRLRVHGPALNVVLTTPEIRFLGLATFVLTLVHQNQDTALRLDGTPVPLSRDPGSSPPFVARGAPHQDAPRFEIRPFVPDHASDHEAFFIRAVHEVHQATVAGDWYLLIRASGLLRLLLIDQQPLAIRVNRRYRLKLRFLVLPRSRPSPDLGIVWSNVSGGDRVRDDLESLELGEFLGTPVLFADDSVGTVKDLVRMCANADGGVHFGTPSTAGEHLIYRHAPMSYALSQRVDRMQLRGIAEVVCRGLAPLVEKIQTSAETGRH